MTPEEQIAIIDELFPEIDFDKTDESYRWTYRCCESELAYSSPIAALAAFAQRQASDFDAVMQVDDSEDEEDEEDELDF